MIALVELPGSHGSASQICPAGLWRKVEAWQRPYLWWKTNAQGRMRSWLFMRTWNTNCSKLCHHVKYIGSETLPRGRVVFGGHSTSQQTKGRRHRMWDFCSAHVEKKKTTRCHDQGLRYQIEEFDTPRCQTKGSDQPYRIEDSDALWCQPKNANKACRQKKLASAIQAEAVMLVRALWFLQVFAL